MRIFVSMWVGDDMRRLSLFLSTEVFHSNFLQKHSVKQLLLSALILFSLCPCQLLGQTHPDSLQGDKYYQQAEVAFYDLSYDQAIGGYKKAMYHFKQAEAWEGYFESLYSIGFIARDEDRFAEADSIFIRGMEEAEERLGRNSLAWVKNCRGRGFIRERNDEFDSAIYFFEQGIRVFEENDSLYDRMELLLYDGMGQAYRRLGLYQKALNAWQMQLQIAAEKYQDRQYDNYPRRVALAYEQIGQLFSAMGEKTKAKAYLAESVRYWENNVYSRREYYSIVKLQNVLGGVYLESGELEPALKAFHQARDLAEEHLPEGDLASSYAYTNLGNFYLEVDNDSARWYASLARNQILTYAPAARYLLALNVSNLGLADLNGAKYDQALNHFEQTLEIIQSFSSGQKLMEVKTLYWMAETHREQGAYDQASEYYDLAFEANRLGGSIAGDQVLNPLNFLNVDWKMRIFYARLLMQSEDSKTADELNGLMAQLDQIIKVAESERDRISFNQDKLALSERLHEFYAFGAHLAHQLYLVNPTEDSYLQAFFTYSEKDKSFSLRSQISQTMLFERAGVPDSLQEVHARIDQEIKAVKRTMSLTGEEYAQGEVKHRLLELDEKKSSHLLYLGEHYPEITSFYGDTALSLEAVQRQMSEAEAYLEFFWTARSVFTLVITKNDTRLLTNEEIFGLKELILDYREAFQQTGLEAHQLQSTQLYQVLFAPVDTYLKSLDRKPQQLIIIPDDVIGLISFDALLSQPDLVRYLIEDYVISYESSLFLDLKRPPVAESATRMMASFTPSFQIGEGFLNINAGFTVSDLSRDQLKPLEGAIRETQEISAIFDGEQFTEVNATESAFKNSAEDYQILHLATHAIADHVDPNHSKLFLGADRDSMQDGSLHAFEIQGLRLNAQLVTLSACDTGFGQIQKGEGVMSLSRAFAFAGCPSTLVSLWPASDKSTPELMKFFYQALKEGKTKDVALREAKRQYLAQARGAARHPFYWGGFVLIGDNQPINQHDTFPWFWLAIGLALSVIMLVFYRKKRTRRFS